MNTENFAIARLEKDFASGDLTQLAIRPNSSPIWSQSSRAMFGKVWWSRHPRQVMKARAVDMVALQIMERTGADDSCT